MNFVMPGALFHQMSYEALEADQLWCENIDNYCSHDQ